MVKKISPRMAAIQEERKNVESKGCDSKLTKVSCNEGSSSSKGKSSLTTKRVPSVNTQVSATVNVNDTMASPLSTSELHSMLKQHEAAIVGTVCRLAERGNGAMIKAYIDLLQMSEKKATDAYSIDPLMIPPPTQIHIMEILFRSMRKLMQSEENSTAFMFLDNNDCLRWKLPGYDKSQTLSGELPDGNVEFYDTLGNCHQYNDNRFGWVDSEKCEVHHYLNRHRRAILTQYINTESESQLNRARVALYEAELRLSLPRHVQPHQMLMRVQNAYEARRETVLTQYCEYDITISRDDTRTLTAKKRGRPKKD